MTLSRPHQTSEVGLRLLVVLTTDAFSSKSANETRAVRHTKDHVTLGAFQQKETRSARITGVRMTNDFSLHSLDSVFMTAVP